MTEGPGDGERSSSHRRGHRRGRRPPRRAGGILWASPASPSCSATTADHVGTSAPRVHAPGGRRAGPGPPGRSEARVAVVAGRAPDPPRRRRLPRRTTAPPPTSPASGGSAAYVVVLRGADEQHHVGDRAPPPGPRGALGGRRDDLRGDGRVALRQPARPRRSSAHLPAARRRISGSPPRPGGGRHRPVRECLASPGATVRGRFGHAQAGPAWIELQGTQPARRPGGRRASSSTPAT